MYQLESISCILLAALLTGCASSPNYLPAPSAKVNKIYQREQVISPVGKQVAGAMLSGAIGGLLGPFGAIISGLGASQTQKITLTNYWKSFSNTKLIGVIVEDISKKRIEEYLNNRHWFKDLPPRNKIPPHFSVDIGSGNLILIPISVNLPQHPKPGDIVEIYSPAHAWHLVNIKAEFSALPMIVEIRCEAIDTACIQDPKNEPGILSRLGPALDH